MQEMVIENDSEIQIVLQIIYLKFSFNYTIGGNFTIVNLLFNYFPR